MANFALLDETGGVLQVVIVLDKALGDIPYPASETAGIEFLRQHYGHTRWKQTSYTRAFRKTPASIGDKFDQTRDAFISVKPFESWVLDEASCVYKAPEDMPTDGKIYTWDEKTVSWVEVI